MLVLSRKEDESIEILDGKKGPVILKISVVSIVRGKVRLGFDADRKYEIRRTELNPVIEGVAAES